LGLAARVFTGAELRLCLSPVMQRSLERNREMFQRERETREATA
jgi:hypothetical protein